MAITETSPEWKILGIEGMMCMKNCGTTVQSSLRNLNEVDTTKVSLEDRAAYVYGSAQFNDLVDAVESVGFEANKIILLQIDGMMCMKNCGTTVQNALRNANGVDEAFVSFDKSMATIRGDAQIDSLIDTVESVGFDARQLSILKIDGMMCMKNCGNTVRNSLKNVAGVSDVEIIFTGPDMTSYAKVIGDVQPSLLIDAVESVGFDAELGIDVGDVEAQKKPKPASVEIPVRELADSNLPHAFFSVEGMSCAACVKSIEGVLAELVGVTDARVGLISQKAEVIFDPDLVNEDQIRECIAGAGYGAKFSHTSSAVDDAVEIKVKVHNYEEISNRELLNQEIMSMEGVLSVSYNEADRIVFITLQSMSQTGGRTIVEKMKSLGYNTSIVSKHDDDMEMLEAGDREIRKWKGLLHKSLLFATPAMIVNLFLSNIPIFSGWLESPLWYHLSIKCVLMWILVTPIQFVVGKRFYVAAYKGLQHRMMGMDFLIVVGTTSSYLYSLVSLIITAISPEYRGHYFFENSAMLITFVTFGKYLESVAKGRTVDALSKLVKMQPKFAVLVETVQVNGKPSQREREIPIELVQKKDILQVRPGECIPTDGVVISGSSTVDESMITGESMPVLKNAGEYVFGSTMNQHGTLCIEAKCTGGDSAVSQICSLIEEAQLNKAPIQDYADRIAGVFAPTVLTLALLTFIVWYSLLTTNSIPDSWRTNDHDDFLFSLLFSISVVVIACPCALGLATPTAVMVGCGVGAKHGVLMKGGGCLQAAKEIDTVVLDKTGTITNGNPSVTDVRPCVESWSSREILRIVASAERGSEHPLAKSILEAAREQQLNLMDSSDFKVTPGRGLSCIVDKKQVIIGNSAWMSENDIEISNSNEISLDSMEDEGKTVICVAVDTQLIGLIAMADQARREAKDVIQQLHFMNIEVWMVTGDNLRTASAIARQVGIDHVKAGALPAEKVSQIKELQMRGQKVAMVGDGINDAPALAQSDVGIAIGAGTEVAVAQADMVLVKSSLCDVVTALDLSRVVFSRIRTNLCFSMVYNIIGIPAAAGAFFPLYQVALPPACAGIAMAMSSVSVVISSLLLNRYQPPNIYSQSDKGQVQNSKVIELSKFRKTPATHYTPVKLEEC